MEKKVCIHFGEDITKSILFVLMLGLEISKSNSTTR